MQLTLNPDCRVHTLFYGEEQLPLLVIDDFITEAAAMIDDAATRQFEANSPLYPGIRTLAPRSFAQLLLQQVSQHQAHFWPGEAYPLGLSICHYSLVTTPPQQLKLLQRIPHFDSVEQHALAAVYYLFHDPQGGTAFYRHRQSGYEYIDDARQIPYYQSLEAENGGPNIPSSTQGYISGDTPLYQQIHHQAGVFNRLIVYRRNSLHSGLIPVHCNFSSDPRQGRLSISSFIDPRR